MDKNKQKQLITEIMNEDAKDGLYKKQTAVEWLFHQLWEEPKDKFTWYAILEKAKEMDKKQREDLIVFSKVMCTSHAHAEYIVNEFNKTYEKDA
jgi:hypothetical protein